MHNNLFRYLLIASVGATACDSATHEVDTPAVPRAADDAGDAAATSEDSTSRLDEVPHWRDFDGTDPEWIETIDLSAYEPGTEVSVWVKAYEEPAQMTAEDADTFELLAESEFMGEVEEDGGVIAHHSRIKLVRGTTARVRLRVSDSPSPSIELRLCDEMVTQLGDAGSGSLREAVARVRPGGSVCFEPFAIDQPAMIHATVLLSSQIALNKSMSILGVRGVELKALGAHRIFTVAAGERVGLRTLVLSDGEAPLGGAIYSEGELYIRDSELRGATAQDRGGSIFSTGSLNLLSTVVAGNTADVGGAGIWCDHCDLVITGGRFSYNETSRGSGGAVTVRTGNLLARRGTQFSNNYAGHAGGAISTDQSRVRLDEVSFIDNVAQHRGGALELENSAPMEADLSGVLVAGNTAWGFGGGGIWSDPTLRLRNSASGLRTEIRDNYGSEGGGLWVESELWVEDDTEIYDNDAGSGGGIMLNGGHAHLLGNTWIHDNTAGIGGGVHFRGALDLYNSARISHNVAAFGGGVAGDEHMFFHSAHATIDHNAATFEDPRCQGLGGGWLLGLPASPGMYPAPPYYPLAQIFANTPDDVYARPSNWSDDCGNHPIPPS